MKLYRLIPAAVALFGLASCDKVSDLADKVSGLWSDVSGDGGGVAVVGEEEGRAIIAEEPKLVMVEFYSDT